MIGCVRASLKITILIILEIKKFLLNNIMLFLKLQVSNYRIQDPLIFIENSCMKRSLISYNKNIKKHIFNHFLLYLKEMNR